ncbi:protein kinase [Saccharothrix saharensis]|uniref:protein kinase domain-containing protein n=1 Tax=Saccharothrix saharensis TaxID=571190 RepID=UPI003690B51D
MRHAIVVGINQYRKSPLAYCVNDARDVADSLTLDNYGYDCDVLLNAQASRSGLRRAFTKRLDAGGGETLLFYFAGHGAVIRRTPYLITSDSEEWEPGISFSELSQVMEEAAEIYRNVISVLDCCHAGASVLWANSKTLSRSDFERGIPTVNESRCLLAACRAEEKAVEDRKLEHGKFTAALLNGLLGDGVNFDGQVTMFDLAKHVAASLGAAGGQVPVFKGDIAGQVVLGDGFPPRRGKPLEGGELQAINSKAQKFIDDYHQVRLKQKFDLGNWSNGGARTCAAELTPKLDWFLRTMEERPEIKNNRTWVNNFDQVVDYQADLANISPGMLTAVGQALRLIGSGGYGRVWEVKLGENGERAAYKVFNSDHLHDKLMIKRFRNGYDNMQKLNHPRIVRVRSFTTAPYGFLMDFVEGDNLRKAYINRDNAEVVLRFLSDIVETVQHAHGHGVLHRDIKPENILVTYGAEGSGPIPHLTDFDLAYHETNRTITTNLGVGGVINYAAPEQLHAPTTQAARSETVDVYSLAQLMFFVLVGRDPQSDSRDGNIAALTKSLNAWTDGRVAQSLIRLYESATFREPGDRLQTVQEFGAVLGQAEAQVLAASGLDAIAERDFCNRLGHLVAGIGKYYATEDVMETRSLSGQVDVSVRIKDAQTKKNTLTLRLELELSAAENIPMPQMKSGHIARERINKRLDKLFKGDHRVARHPGNKGVYQVFLDILDVPSTLEGLARVRDVLAKAVSGIEQW